MGLGEVEGAAAAAGQAAEGEMILVVAWVCMSSADWVMPVKSCL